MKSVPRSTPMSFKIALSKVIPLCLVAVLIAGVLISVANDTYAFVKPDRPITVEITAGTTDKRLSYLLQDFGVIENPSVFCLYLRSRATQSDILALSGTKELNSKMSYREIISVLF